MSETDYEGRRVTALQIAEDAKLLRQKIYASGIGHMAHVVARIVSSPTEDSADGRSEDFTFAAKSEIDFAEAVESAKSKLTAKEFEILKIDNPL